MLKKCLSVLLSLVLVFSVTAVALTADAADITLRFGADGKFKIVVFADCQDDESPYQTMIDFMDFALTVEQPDLVVFTGDNVHVNTISKFRTGCRKILAPINAHQVPFAYTFGNHDADKYSNYDTAKAQMHEVYMESPYCLTYDAAPSTTGFGNCNIPIYASTGSDIAFNLWIIDSNMYASDGGYDNVHQDQQDWMVATNNALTASVGHKVNSMVFQHIVVPEVYNCLIESEVGTKTYNGKKYLLGLNDNAEGYLGEFPCPPNTNSGEFTTLKNMGDVIGIVTGHDHANSFVGHWQGVDFIQMPGMTFESYGDDACRGYGVIELDERDTTTYSSHTVRYSEQFERQLALYHGTNDRYYSVPQTGTYISDLAVGSDGDKSKALSALTDNGYTPIDFDLNKGAGGNYIYLGYKTTTNYEDALKDIRFYSDPSDASNFYYELNINGKACGYYMYGSDLNKESGGDYIYFFATDNGEAGPPITQISFDESSSGANTCGTLLSPGTPAELNNGTTKHQTNIYCHTATSAVDVTAAANSFLPCFAAVDGSDISDLSRYTQESRSAFEPVYQQAAALNAALTGQRATTLTATQIAQLTADLPAKCAGLTTLQTRNGCMAASALSFDSAQAAGCFNDDYVTVEVQHNAFFPAAARVGTGCNVKVAYPGGTQQYEAVVVGDVNGDGWYDGTDAFYVRLVASGLVPLSVLSKGQQLAADCNHDNAVTEEDVALLEKAGVLLAQIDTSLSEPELAVNAVYREYFSLIDQSVECTQLAQEQPAAATPEASAKNALSALWELIVRVFDYLKNMVLSFLPF